MFLEFYGLHEQPFGVTPDPRYLYVSSTHREALSSLYYGLETSRGFLTLIAPPGMGKTTLLFHLLERLRSTAHTAFLFQTQCDSRELFRYLLSDLGIDAGDQNLARMHEKLNEVLINDARAGKRFILVIDEAQNLEDSVLETVRLLSDFETPQAKLMQIVLAGQPQLADKLTRPGLAQLRQRISIVSRLEPFTPAETVMYIDHRLAVAGHSGDSIFTYDALALIAVQSGGIPRNINNLCFNALSLGFAKGQKRIDAATVREILSDLNLDLLGSLRDAARYVSPIAIPAAEVNWNSDVVNREVQAAAKAVRELRTSPRSEDPAAERHARERREPARQASEKVETPKPAENSSIEEVRTAPHPEGFAAIAALEFQPNTQTEADPEIHSGLDAAALESRGTDGHDPVREELHTDGNKRVTIRGESERLDSKTSVPAVTEIPPATSATEVAQQAGKEGPESATARTSKHAIAPGKVISQLPRTQPGVVAMEKTQPASANPSVSLFQRSGQVWRKIFRKGAFSYGLVVLLALAFLWPNRDLTTVRATQAPVPEQEKAADQAKGGTPRTREVSNPKPADPAPVTVVVQADETLSHLAQKHIGTYDGKALAEIQALNPAIKDPNLIVVGQKIQMPHTTRETNEIRSPANGQQAPR